MPIWLEVSFPSEMMTSAFFWFRPRAAIGTASDTASYNAVPPSGMIRSSTRDKDDLVRRPPLQQHRRVAEAIDEHLVAFVEEIRQEAIERAAGRLNLFAGHAAAGVERDAEADRHSFGAELRDGLPNVVFIDDEVVLGEVGHEAAVGIRHRGRDVHQLDAALEAERVLVLCRRLLAARASRRRRAKIDRNRQRAKSVHHLRST